MATSGPGSVKSERKLRTLLEQEWEGGKGVGSRLVVEAQGPHEQFGRIRFVFLSRTL